MLFIYYLKLFKIEQFYAYIFDNIYDSVGAENTFDKIKHLFMIKTLEKLGSEGNILMLIKYIYKTLHIFTK